MHFYAEEDDWVVYGILFLYCKYVSCETEIWAKGYYYKNQTTIIRKWQRILK